MAFPTSAAPAASQAYCSQATNAIRETLGSHLGDAVNCEQGACAHIPTLSEWGAMAMALLVLTASTVVLLRRRLAV
jgi:hypothetical protein